jgi:hypothetical protein
MAASSVHSSEASFGAGNSHPSSVSDGASSAISHGGGSSFGTGRMPANARIAQWLNATQTLEPSLDNPAYVGLLRSLFETSKVDGGGTTIDGLTPIRLARGRVGLSTVAEKLAGGAGVDRLRGTLVVASGVPQKLHAFRHENGRWMRHDLDAPGSTPVPMDPSKFLRSLRADNSNYSGEIYKIRRPGDPPVRGYAEMPPSPFTQPREYARAVRQRLAGG